MIHIERTRKTSNVLEHTMHDIRMKDGIHDHVTTMIEKENEMIHM
jgi:serine kinase of HPr protein (carbohydrate metabolism regulator)